MPLGAYPKLGGRERTRLSGAHPVRKPGGRLHHHLTEFTNPVGGYPRHRSTDADCGDDGSGVPDDGGANAAKPLLILLVVNRIAHLTHPLELVKQLLTLTDRA